MGIHENFERASKINREDEKRLLEKHDLLSKDKLQKVIKTKMKTSFIGALSAVELSFEELWKINPSDDDYDIKEKQYWKNIWEKCRSEILNNGNNQLRSVESEIDQYSVSWNGHVRNYSIGG